MKCCAECFGDRGLRRSIIPLRSAEVGQCSYCGSENVATVVPAQLSEYFELLISAYRQDAGGKLLVQWFREEWGLFGHSRMDDSRAKDLLAEILDDGRLFGRHLLQLTISQKPCENTPTWILASLLKLERPWPKDASPHHCVQRAERMGGTARRADVP